MLQILHIWAKEINALVKWEPYCQYNPNCTWLSDFITQLGPTFEGSAKTPWGNQIQKLHDNDIHFTALMHE